MEWTLGTVGLALIGLGLLSYFFIAKGKESKKVSGIMAVVGILMFAGGGGLGMLDRNGDGISGFTIGDSDTTEFDDCDLIDSFTIKARNEFTQAGTGEDFEWYDTGAEVSRSTTTEILKVDVSSGTVTDTTGYILSTCDDEDTMDLYYEGSSNFYNELVPEWRVVGNVETGKAIIKFGDSLYYDASPIGTLTDLDTASATSGGEDWLDTGTDTVDFNITSGSDTDRTIYGEYELGNSVANAVIQDFVLCIQDANSGTDALDGVEVDTLTITRRAGDNLDKNGQLQGDLTTWFTDSAGSGQAICKVLANELGSNEVGTYRFSLSLDISEWTDANEKLAFYQDDLGGYKVYQYPDASMKASASGFTINGDDD